MTKILGPLAAETSIRVGRAMRLGAISMDRARIEVIYPGALHPRFTCDRLGGGGAATSRMSGSDMVGGADFKGMLGHAGAGAVVGAPVRKSTTKIYIVVSYPGGQWVAGTSHVNEWSARRFAAKVNSL